MGANAHSAARRPLARALAAIVVVAALAALLIGYRPSLTPPGLHPRQLALGAAQAEVLVDTKSSQLAGITPASVNANTLAAQLAVNYALYLQSDPATAVLGQALGLHGMSVAASGPFTLLLGRENLGAQTPNSAQPDPGRSQLPAAPGRRRRTPDARASTRRRPRWPPRSAWSTPPARCCYDTCAPNSRLSPSAKKRSC